MAYAQHIRMTVTGRFDTSANFGEDFEGWSYRLNLSDPATAADPVDEAGTAADMANDVLAFHVDPVTRISNVARLREVKFARIGADGKYISDPRILTFDAPGGGGALKYPTQIACAVSLLTARRGGTGRGRIYLPAPTLSLGGNTGRVVDSEQQALAVRVQTFLNNLNNGSGVGAPEPRVVIASTRGYNSDVTGCRVGQVLDTMRSRRTSILENYGVVRPVT
jgi:hypothetical protein